MLRRPQDPLGLSSPLCSYPHSEHPYFHSKLVLINLWWLSLCSLATYFMKNCLDLSIGTVGLLCPWSCLCSKLNKPSSSSLSSQGKYFCPLAILVAYTELTLLFQWLSWTGDPQQFLDAVQKVPRKGRGWWSLTSVYWLCTCWQSPTWCWPSQLLGITTRMWIPAEVKLERGPYVWTLDC